MSDVEESSCCGSAQLISRWLFWPALAVVAWGELTPRPPALPGPVGMWDKLDHFTAYFGLFCMLL